jgi:hypothetical protein
MFGCATQPSESESDESAQVEAESDEAPSASDAALADPAADEGDVEATGDHQIVLPGDQDETAETGPRLSFHYPNHANWVNVLCAGRSHTYPAGYPTPNIVSNGCSFRVWLHQWNNYTGYQLCVSPHSSVRLNRAYKSYTMTVNPRGC